MVCICYLSARNKMLAAINEVELLLSLDQIDYSYSANLTLNQMIEGKVLRAYVHGMCSDIPCVELFYANEETNEVI